MTRNVQKLSISISGDGPPTEFRLFKVGKNETTKGTFIFDAKSARLVMAEYRRHGIDLPIDYEHASLDVGVDPSLSGKAAGWFNLELRGGELWAVNVRWTEPAANAIRLKEWRFYSPAFTVEDNRIVSLMNCAITNLPATRQLTPLIAASKKKGKLDMSSGIAEQATEALEALEAEDLETVKAALESILAEAEEGEGDEEPEPTEGLTEGEEEEDEDEDEEISRRTRSTLRALTGAPTTRRALEQLATYKRSHAQLAKERAKMAEERKLIEANERRELCIRLVREGGRAPVTVWADPFIKGKPKAYLSRMPIGDLRAYVKDHVSSVAPIMAARRGFTPPPSGDDFGEGVSTPHGAVTLSQAELDRCAERNVDPKVYAKTKARQLRARGNI